jgi:hypothetical protein
MFRAEAAQAKERDKVVGDVLVQIHIWVIYRIR